MGIEVERGGRVEGKGRSRLAAAVATLSLCGVGLTAQEPGREPAREPGRGAALLRECEVVAHAGPALCGAVEVWEDPAAGAGRRLTLNVVVLEPTGPAGERVPDPVFVLDGGPGQAATRSVGWVSAELSDVLRTRAVVLVDRRGTGGSNPLDCPSEAGPDAAAAEVLSERGAAWWAAWVSECRDALEVRADLTRYTSPYAADDLDVVRGALGYERINLYGGSYGSREAFEYMRHHPERLRAGAVFAVTPQHERAMLESPASAQRALDRLIDDCMADGPCRAAYPGLRGELWEVVGRLEAAPAEFTLPVPGGGRTGPLRLTRGRWAGLVRSILLSPAGGAQVPYLIHQTYLGEYEAVGGLYVRLARSTPGAISRGLFLSVICAEDMARTGRAEVRSAAEGTFWGPSWVEGVMDQCEGWPVGRLPDGWADPPRGDTPFLFLSGWLDPIAPAAWAGELTRWMPNARRVLVREGHHNFTLDACARSTLARFYDTADPFNLDVSCIAALEGPDFLVPEGGS